MSDGHRNNHYVPVWYQHRFLQSHLKERKFRYLDLKPDVVTDSQGRRHTKTALRRWGPEKCFCAKDLYTTTLGPWFSTEIEKRFFGPIDDESVAAVDYWTNYNHSKIEHSAFDHLIRYMTLQKLRTPKGLAYIAAETRARNHNDVLMRLQALQRFYGAIWAEAEWSIVDASSSPTKFIISDHPVTVYNLACFPGSSWCRDWRDPEPWLAATHTYFPLSLDKLLILTNTAWVRNPYGNPTKPRPNPNPTRSAVFKFTDVQTGRQLTEEEVLMINYITKKRAHRYVAGSDEEWLHPERRLTKTHWSKFGGGLLFMPDPREVSFSSQIVMGGYASGRPADVWDEYGRRPGQPNYDDVRLRDKEWRTFHAFQGEFARLIGPDHRGYKHSFGSRAATSDSPEHHSELLASEIPGLSRKRRGN